MLATYERDQASIDEAVAILQQRFGERLSTSKSVCQQHGSTVTFHENMPPDAVVYVRKTEEIVDIVDVCASRKVPVIPFGTGTSLEGHLNAVRGGISIDLSGMNEIIEINPHDLDCTVQPGVTRKQLNSFLRDQGLFFPIDPGADASIGGMVATRASGTNAVRYGTMRDSVVRLSAVMADGSVIKTGSRTKKSSAGYDLTRLLIGSEGTLGIITEITLKLYGIPEQISSGVCTFETLEGACDTTILAMQTGIPLARIELLDDVMMAAVNNYSNLDLPVKPTLFLEFHGSSLDVEQQILSFKEIAEDFGGTRFDWATQEEDRNRLWQARHDAYWAGLQLAPGKEAIVSDVCVPISKLAECVTETKEDIEESGLIGPIVGHVGDGNFHSALLVDATDDMEVAKAKMVMDRLVARAHSMDGTCTGEHGVGTGKIKYMEAEFGKGLKTMNAIKFALDPDNIMNPGKIIDLS